EQVLETGPMADMLPQSGEGMIETRAQMVQVLAGVLPAALAVHWFLRAILSAGLAQVSLTRLNLARGPVPEYSRFQVPNWFVIPVGLLIAAGWLGEGNVGFIAASAATVLCLPLILQGLAVVHCAAAQTRQRIAVLAVFYVLALLLASVAVVMLVILGMMEQFFDIRAKYFTARAGGE
ncbi:MAG: DUF2232 domain-containing protein, partial [Rhodospirillaceae bacterium]